MRTPLATSRRYDDAELGEVLDILRLRAHEPDDAADGDAGDQITENRAQTQTLGDRYGNDRGTQIDECLKQ